MAAPTQMHCVVIQINSHTFARICVATTLTVTRLIQTAAMVANRGGNMCVPGKLSCEFNWPSIKITHDTVNRIPVATPTKID